VASVRFQFGESDNLILSRPLIKHRKTNGPHRISFQELARSVANAWKKLDSNSKGVFREQAAIEKNEYKKALKEWSEAAVDTESKPQISMHQAISEISHCCVESPIVQDNRSLTAFSVDGHDSIDLGTCDTCSIASRHEELDQPSRDGAAVETHHWSDVHPHDKHITHHQAPRPQPQQQRDLQEIEEQLVALQSQVQDLKGQLHQRRTNEYNESCTGFDGEVSHGTRPPAEELTAVDEEQLMGMLLKDFTLEEDVNGPAEEQLNLLLKSFEPDI